MPLRGGECVYYQLSKCQKGARCQFYHRPLEPDICRSFLFQKCKYQTNPRQCGKRHVRCQDLPLPSQTEMDRVKQVKMDAKEDASKTESDDEFSTSPSGSTYRQNISLQTGGTSEKHGQVLGCFDCGVQVLSPWDLKEHVESKDHQQIMKRLKSGGKTPEGIADDFSQWCIDCNIKVNSSSQSQHHNRGNFHSSMLNALKEVKLAILTGKKTLNCSPCLISNIPSNEMKSHLYSRKHYDSLQTTLVCQDGGREDRQHLSGKQVPVAIKDISNHGKQLPKAINDKSNHGKQVPKAINNNSYHGPEGRPLVKEKVIYHGKNPPFEVFVGNLSPMANASFLQTKLEKFGDVSRVHVIRNKPPLACAIVQFKNGENAQHAIDALNQTEFEGRKLQVRWKDVKVHSSGTRIFSSNSSSKLEEHAKTSAEKIKKEFTVSEDFHCDTCKIFYPSQSHLNQHYLGKQHLSNIQSTTFMSDSLEDSASNSKFKDSLDISEFNDTDQIFEKSREIIKSDKAESQSKDQEIPSFRPRISKVNQIPTSQLDIPEFEQISPIQKLDETHNAENMIRCSICGKDYAQIKEFIDHCRSLKNHSAAIPQCRDCGYLYKSTQDFKRHLTTSKAHAARQDSSPNATFEAEGIDKSENLEKSNVQEKILYPGTNYDENIQFGQGPIDPQQSGLLGQQQQSGLLGQQQQSVLLGQQQQSVLQGQQQQSVLLGQQQQSVLLGQQQQSVLLGQQKQSVLLGQQQQSELLGQQQQSVLLGQQQQSVSLGQQQQALLQYQLAMQQQAIQQMYHNPAANSSLAVSPGMVPSAVSTMPMTPGQTLLSRQSAILQLQEQLKYQQYLMEMEQRQEAYRQQNLLKQAQIQQQLEAQRQTQMQLQAEAKKQADDVRKAQELQMEREVEIKRQTELQNAREIQRKEELAKFAEYQKIAEDKRKEEQVLRAETKDPINKYTQFVKQVELGHQEETRKLKDEMSQVRKHKVETVSDITNKKEDPSKSQNEKKLDNSNLFLALEEQEKLKKIREEQKKQLEERKFIEKQLCQEKAEIDTQTFPSLNGQNSDVFDSDEELHNKIRHQKVVEEQEMIWRQIQLRKAEQEKMEKEDRKIAEEIELRNRSQHELNGTRGHLNERQVEKSEDEDQVEKIRRLKRESDKKSLLKREEYNKKQRYEYQRKIEEEKIRYQIMEKERLEALRRVKEKERQKKISLINSEDVAVSPNNAETEPQLSEVPIDGNIEKLIHEAKLKKEKVQNEKKRKERDRLNSDKKEKDESMQEYERERRKMADELKKRHYEQDLEYARQNLHLDEKQEDLKHESRKKKNDQEVGGALRRKKLSDENLKKNELQQRKQKEKEEKEKRMKEVKLQKLKIERKKAHEEEAKAKKEALKKQEEHLKRMEEKKKAEEEAQKRNLEDPDKQNRLRREMAQERKDEGMELRKAGKYKQAAKKFSDCIYFDPTAEHYIQRADCHILDQSYKLGYKDVKKAQNLNPFFPNLDLLMAKCCIGMGDFLEAKNNLNLINEMGDGRPTVEVTHLLKKLDDLEAREGQIIDNIRIVQLDGIIDLIDKCLELAGECMRFYAYKAEVFVLEGNFEGANRIIKTIKDLSCNLSSPLVPYLKGFLLYHKDVPGCVDWFRQAVKIGPVSNKIKDVLAKSEKLYYLRNMANQAVTEANSANRERKDNWEELFTNKMDEASQFLSEALDQELPNKKVRAIIFYERAVLIRKLPKDTSNLRRCIDDCSDAISNDMLLEKAYLLRAECYCDFEDYVNAAIDYETLQKIQRHNPEYRRLADDSKRREMIFRRENSFYKVLGVPKTANTEEIKKSYRRKALLAHPDKHVESTAAVQLDKQQEMRRLNKAYSVLSDPAERRRYDNILNGEPQLSFSFKAGSARFRGGRRY